MDRPQIFRGQVPFETDLLSANRLAMEALGLFAADVLGQATVVSRLACTPTSPASMSVKVGPGSIYKLSSLEATAMGQLLGTGGLAADTNADHQIMKQGLLRDTQTFAMTAPVTSGQSVVYLIEAQFQETDDATIPTQFYNTANPNAPITSNASPFRRDICALQVKAGTPATTGSQVCPAADAGWVPVWAVTIAFGATAIVAGNIAAAPSAPFVSIGSGGGGSPVTNWTTVTSSYIAVNGDKLVADVSGGTFTITLPAAPVADVTAVRIKGNFATTNLTVNPNGHQYDFGSAGLSSTLTLNKDSIDTTILFDGVHWRI